jgi:proline iminopeptidase
MVFGGSWGSVLALAYAQTHPERCGSLVLRGVYLGTKKEIEMQFRFLSEMWPEEYDEFVSGLEGEERERPLDAFHERCMSEDRNVAVAAWKAWHFLGLAISGAPRVVGEAEMPWVESYAKVATHYFVNGSFLEDGQFLRDCERIKHIPSEYYYVEHVRCIAEICSLYRSWA